MSKKHEWTRLGKDKLNSSGLNSTQGTALGMYEVVSAAQLDKSFEAKPALVIPYFGPDRKPLSPHPKWPVFYRVRYLGESKVKGFEDVTGGKPKRYAQPPESGTCAYFPTTTDWPAIIKDPEYEIIITEGELKAACASVEGFPTIGLGGVWNFRSSKEGVWFLPELEAVKWAKRTVYICFDNDYLSKPGVCQAINGLVEELQERGAFIRVISLPASEEKVGLDDYLVAKGADALRERLAEAEPLGLTQALWRINEEVVYVEDPGMIVVNETLQKIDTGKFKNESQWATASTTETRVSTQGTLIREKVPAAPVWIRWPHRRSASRMTYAPGEERFTAKRELNLWPGWGVEPKKGDVTPWLKLTKFLFADAEPGILEYFYDWCAYPIQHPGTKMFVAVVIHSTAQGTGKTMLGYTLRGIYGENFNEIGDDDLEETYWAENKQFILGDEITGKDNRQHMNMLKRLITKDSIDINIKFIPQYTLPNCMNFLFTSQHGDSFFLEDKDRRFMVIEVQGDPLPQAFYDEYDRWYKPEKGGQGCAHLMQWFLDRKISPGFNPSAPAPRTMAKERMIVATKGDAASWVHELKTYPDQVLCLGQMTFTRDLFSSAELLKIYEGVHSNTKLTAVGLGRQLSGAGLVQVNDGAPIMNPNTGKMERLFAVRNLEFWRKHGKDAKKLKANLMLSPKREKK